MGTVSLDFHGTKAIVLSQPEGNEHGTNWRDIDIKLDDGTTVTITCFGEKGEPVQVLAKTTETKCEEIDIGEGC